MKDLIGLELELQIADQDGRLKNQAPKIINNSKNTNGTIAPELSHSMIEIIAPPFSELGRLEDSFKNELNLAIQIAQEQGLILYPSTTIGPKSIPASNFNPRYIAKRIILGNYKRDLEHHICGTHVHIDKIGEEEGLFKQYLLMTAADPLFTLMSSSPFFLGTNSLKDYRVHIYRHEVFADFPLQGQLLDYPHSLQEAFIRQRETFEHWINLCEEKNTSSEGFDLLNTCWGPLRFSPRTLESRSSDTNLFSRVMALAAVYKGLINYIKEEKPNIEFGDETLSDVEYFVSKKGTITIPNHLKLKEYETAGINLGLDSNELRIYLSNILQLAQSYLKENEQKYLAPFFEQISTRKTLADEIVIYATQKGLEKDCSIDEKGAQEIRKYIAKRFLDDLRKDQ